MYNNAKYKNSLDDASGSRKKHFAHMQFKGTYSAIPITWCARRWERSTEGTMVLVLKGLIV